VRTPATDNSTRRLYKENGTRLRQAYDAAGSVGFMRPMPRISPMSRMSPICSHGTVEHEDYGNADESDSHKGLDPCANALRVILFDVYRRC